MGARPRIRKPKSTLAARARGGVSRTSTARCLCRAPSGAAIRRRTRPAVRTRSDFSPAHARSPLPLRAAVLLCGCADEHFRASGERKGLHSGATDRPFAAAGSQPQGMRAGCVLAAPILGILHFARRGIALHTPSLLSHLFALFRSSRRRTGWWLTGDDKLSVYLGADGCLWRSVSLCRTPRKGRRGGQSRAFSCARTDRTTRAQSRTPSLILIITFILGGAATTLQPIRWRGHSR